ncbi:hypothetical protein AB6809_06315 [Paraburkholderia sp. RCC_158]|uniref:hypothetical protein n=1 Tax=Paraburkholderia sp. RCC_158 TaxID=3239220 RepID=UPI003525D01C
MKNRILTIACVSTAAALLAACTAVYKNSDACEQLMRSKFAETSSDTLKIGHTGAGIDGSRVVVEGLIEHVVTASEVAAARAASVAKGGSKGIATAGAMGGSKGTSATGAMAGSDAAASGARAAAAPASGSATSDAQALAVKSGKPKKVVQAAAAECTFSGPSLSSFSWLAPAKLAAPSEPDSDEAAE